MILMVMMAITAITVITTNYIILKQNIVMTIIKQNITQQWNLNSVLTQ